VIPFIDLQVQYQSIKGDIGAAMDEVLENTTFILGLAVERFEKKFAAYVNGRHVVGVNSGTSALHLALLAARVGPGDEVIVLERRGKRGTAQGGEHGVKV
jgi:dTDP-4-amino-4,6-dideoxygalactose transaminase